MNSNVHINFQYLKMEDLKTMIQQEKQMLKFMLEKMNEASTNVSCTPDSRANSMRKFSYNPEEELVFQACYKRYEEII